MRKQWRSWSNATCCGIWPGSALFYYLPQKGRSAHMGLIVFCCCILEHSIANTMDQDNEAVWPWYTYLSQYMRFPTMWYVRPAKSQIRLRIRAVWSEPLLGAWVFYNCLATDWTPFKVTKLKRRLQRLVWVYTCQNATLLEISCTGSKFCNAEKKYLNLGK